MDFSLPSSYDSISSSKASTDTLVITPDEKTATPSVAPSKKSSVGVASMYDGSSKKEKKSKKAVAMEEEIEAEKVKSQKITIVDMDLPSYGDSTKGKEKSVFAF